MPDFGPDWEQEYGAGASPVQAVASRLRAGRTPGLHLTFTSTATPGNDPVHGTDTSDGISLASMSTGIAADVVARPSGIAAAGAIGPTSRLVIGWSIAVPDT